MLLIVFEVMFFLEGWNFARTLSGMIAVVALQRFFLKLIIALTLTREFKSDQSNIAFWNGKWYAMGWHSVSQPAREYLCKITELSMFAADFVLGHFLLFLMLPIILIPQIDKLHSMMLFWLRPSRQIRAPIYSMKQSKLRRRRVFRFAVLYFVLFVVFMGLIIAPVFVGTLLPPDVSKAANQIGMNLYQPNNQPNDNTNGEEPTGIKNPSYSGKFKPTETGTSPKATPTPEPDTADP